MIVGSDEISDAIADKCSVPQIKVIGRTKVLGEIQVLGTDTPSIPGNNPLEPGTFSGLFVGYWGTGHVDYQF